ncbi:hypothetical protein [Cohnella terricola]|uniref:Uncharacterized protein n=1 Tax=Cohnella terricola TaxID=1289167 RepID=A0A559J7Z8_9BACL|nr:hypothetical protein [Cohnella terricola]TVX95977.1 hypothetical protein FPZ45_22440 [Cohnella terricola]
MEVLQGKYLKPAKDRNSFEIFNAEPEILLKIAFFLREYGFVSRPMIVGFDGNYLDLEQDNIKLHLGWDVWSGLFLSAIDEEGDIWVEKLGEEINIKLKESYFGVLR